MFTIAQCSSSGNVRGWAKRVASGGEVWTMVSTVAAETCVRAARGWLNPLPRLRPGRLFVRSYRTCSHRRVFSSLSYSPTVPPQRQHQYPRPPPPRSGDYLSSSSIFFFFSHVERCFSLRDNFRCRDWGIGDRRKSFFRGFSRTDEDVGISEFCLFSDFGKRICERLAFSKENFAEDRCTKDVTVNGIEMCAFWDHSFWCFRGENESWKGWQCAVLSNCEGMCNY